jgi:hypothetical protein
LGLDCRKEYTWRCMRIDPNTNHILLDYVAMTEKFGPLDFGEFVAVWHAATAFMDTALSAGFAPEDVPDLLPPDLPL